MSSNCARKNESVFDAFPWLVDVARKCGGIYMTADPCEDENEVCIDKDEASYKVCTRDGLYYWCKYNNKGTADIVSDSFNKVDLAVYDMRKNMMVDQVVLPVPMDTTEKAAFDLFIMFNNSATSPNYPQFLSIQYDKDGVTKAAYVTAYPYWRSVQDYLRVTFKVADGKVSVESLGMDDGLPLDHPVPYAFTGGWLLLLENELGDKLALAQVMATFTDFGVSFTYHKGKNEMMYIVHADADGSFIQIDEPSRGGPVVAYLRDSSGVRMSLDIGNMHDVELLLSARRYLSKVPEKVFRKHWRELPDIFYLAYATSDEKTLVVIGPGSTPYVRVATDANGRLDVLKFPGEKRISVLHSKEGSQEGNWMTEVVLTCEFHAGFVMKQLAGNPHDVELAVKLSVGFTDGLKIAPDTMGGHLHGYVPPDADIPVKLERDVWVCDIPAHDGESTKQDAPTESEAKMSDEDIMCFLNSLMVYSLAELEVYLDLWNEMRESNMGDGYIRWFFKKNLDSLKRAYREMTADPNEDPKEEIRKAVQNMKETGMDWAEVADILARTLAEVYSDNDSIEAMKQVVPNVDCALTPAIVQNLSNTAKDAKEDIDLPSYDEEAPKAPVEDKPTAMTLRDFIQRMYDGGVPVTKAVEEVSECMLSIYGTVVTCPSPYTQAWGVAEHSPDDDQRALWAGTCGADSAQGVTHSCDDSVMSAHNDAYDTQDEEPPESEPEDDEPEDDEPEDDVIDPCGEIEDIINSYADSFEGQPIRKIVFSHFRLSPNEMRCVADWKDTPCPMSLKVEVVYTYDAHNIYPSKWSAESVFYGKTYKVSTATMVKLINEYNETYNYLVK